MLSMPYDVVIIGGSTSGAFLAKRLAEKGFLVKVIEKSDKENVGGKMDIVHIARAEFDRFDLPRVKKGSPEWGFEFEENYTASPTNKYPKKTFVPMVGLHMHEYVLLMNKQAETAGAEFEYSATFTDFIYKDDKIVGVKYEAEGEEKDAYCKVVVDCSGIPSVARRKLPDSFGMEKFEITPEDMFYVILYYVKFKETPKNTGWPYHKSWIAPSNDKDGKILGIGACHSYEYAEKMFERFLSDVKLPEYKLIKTERGMTPYTRPPFTLVADNFIAAGDAACLTKPNNGEGITSSMVQLEIVAAVLEETLMVGDCSKEKLWPINIRYNKEQGADFSSTRAILTKAVSANKKEFEYFFKKDIIFSEKFLNSATVGPEVKVSVKDALHIGFGILGALLIGKLSLKTVKNLVSGLMLGGKIKKHYLNFPVTPVGFEEWSKKALKLWNKVGKMQ